MVPLEPVDAAAEEHCQADPEAGPQEGLLDVDHVGLPVETPGPGLEKRARMAKTIQPTTVTVIFPALVSIPETGTDGMPCELERL